MRQLFTLLGTLGIVGLIVGTAVAYVNDAPHNETNNIECGSCHTYSLWWQFSPKGENDPSYGGYTNAVCDSCHTKAGFPYKITHSYTSMAEMHDTATGNWATNCIDCHDPHQQAQLNWLAIDPSFDTDLFLVSGTVTFVAIDTPIAGETTITYDAPTITINGTGWSSPNSANQTDLTWENKNAFSGRGLIFVHDTTNLTNSYSIISVDSTTSTIVVNGIPDSPGIAVNDSFGLIYGQLVKQEINTPNSGLRTVKFFNPLNTSGTGGFADLANIPPEGVCQVCHTLTHYWREDGTVVDAVSFLTAPADHNSAATCTSCHDTTNGFKPTNADHTFFSSTGTTCANCHSDTDDVIIDTHNGVCNHCHISPPILQNNFLADTDSKWPSTPHTNGTCLDCHDSNGPGPQDIAGDFTNHPKALDDDGNATNGLNGHLGQVSGATNCTNSCHFHYNKDIITEIHTGGPVPSDPCIKCHKLTMETPPTYNGTQLTAKGTYSGSGELINDAIAGPGDCTNCHAGIAANWKTHPNLASHVGQVDPTGTGLCTRCHTGDTIDVVHKFNCGLCHDGANSGALISLADTNGPGTCTNCHGTDFYLHDITLFKTFNHEAAGLVTPEPAGSVPDCMACHNEGPDMINDIHVPVDPLLIPTTNVCAHCHNPDGYLQGDATGHGLNDSGFVGPNICSTCHVDHLTGHPSHVGGDIMNGWVLATARCVTCHTGDRVIDVHNNNCLDCHESLFREGIVNLLPGLPDPATAIDPGHLQCAECHVALADSFFAADFTNKKDHWKKDNHDGQVDASSGCATCHGGTPIEDVHWGSGLCSTCHSQIGELQGSASGLGTGKPPTGSTDCMTCHGAFTLHSTITGLDLSHTLEVQNEPSCNIAGCHTELDLVNGIHATKGCTTCHADTGDLVTPAIPLGGTCTECHTTYFDAHQHGINSHEVAMMSDVSNTEESGGQDQPCNTCHLDLSWGGILAIHNINFNGSCSTCHLSIRSTNVDTAVGDGDNSSIIDVQDVILWGSITNPVDCLKCHKNAATGTGTPTIHP